MSLPKEDLDFLDAYAREQGCPSRSAALHKAISLLRSHELADAYEDAWADWSTSGDADVWEATAADGLEA